jgi:hypothetical protein
MMSASQIVAISLLVSTGVLLLGQRLFSPITPAWLDILLIGLSALCLVGAIIILHIFSTEVEKSSDLNDHDGA